MEALLYQLDGDNKKEKNWRDMIMEIKWGFDEAINFCRSKVHIDYQSNKLDKTKHKEFDDLEKEEETEENVGSLQKASCLVLETILLEDKA